MRSSAGSIDIPWVNSQSGWGGNDAACRQLCSCRGMLACLAPLHRTSATLITASFHSNIHPYHCFLTLPHPPLSLLPYTPTSTLIPASLHPNIHPYHCFLTLQHPPLSLQHPHLSLLLYTPTFTLIIVYLHSNIHPYHCNIHTYHCFLTL